MTAIAAVPSGAKGASSTPHLSTKWTTPRILRLLLGVIFALTAALFLLGEGTTSRARRSLNVLAQEAAPSIIAAQEIGALLADLDANAANYLLGTRAHARAAAMLYDERRIHLTERLIDAAANISAGDAEKQPVRALFENLGRYQELVAQARMEKDRDDAAGALETYRTATTLMHEQVLPAADALDRVKRGYMDDDYAAVEDANRVSIAWARITALALALVLVGTQIFLKRRVRRVVNPALVGATVLSAALAWLLVAKLETAADDLRIAKEDAFDSIHLLWRTRAILFDANGDESRFLLEPSDAARDPKGAANKQASEAAFEAHVSTLTSLPEDSSPSPKKLDKDSLFARLLHNVTFVGERDAVAVMIRAFAVYYRIDGKMRDLERSGRHDEAIALCIGDGDDGSNAALAKLDAALERMLAINRKAFLSTIDLADGGLHSAEEWDPILAAAIALLAYLGMRPRLKEYAA